MPPRSIRKRLKALDDTSTFERLTRHPRVRSFFHRLRDSVRRLKGKPIESSRMAPIASWLTDDMPPMTQTEQANLTRLHAIFGGPSKK